MAICNFCGQESGGTKYCQNCGANLDSNPMNQTSVPMMNSTIPQPTFTMPQDLNAMNQPCNQPQPTYMPGSCADLQKKITIVLVISIFLICTMFGLVSVVLSANALAMCGKIKQAKSQEEEEKYRDTATNCLKIASGVLVASVFIIVLYARMFRI